MWPWTRTKPEVKEPDVMNRTSEGWATEIARLRADLAATEQAIDAATAELGAALLEAQEAKAGDLQNQTVGLEARRRGLDTAISEAERQRGLALQDEERQRQSLRLREGCAQAAVWLGDTAAINEAAATLARLRADRARHTDEAVLLGFFRTFSSRGLQHPDDALNGPPERVSQAIDYYREMAERGALDASGRVTLSGEALDHVPEKPRAQPTPEELAASAAGIRRSHLRQVTSLLGQARRNLAACTANNDRAGIATQRAEVERLEARQAELAAEPVAVAT